MDKRVQACYLLFDTCIDAFSREEGFFSAWTHAERLQEKPIRLMDFLVVDCN